MQILVVLVVLVAFVVGAAVVSYRFTVDVKAWQATVASEPETRPVRIVAEPEPVAPMVSKASLYEVAVAKKVQFRTRAGGMLVAKVIAPLTADRVLLRRPGHRAPFIRPLADIRLRPTAATTDGAEAVAA
jgi:hypothetical protein